MDYMTQLMQSVQPAEDIDAYLNVDPADYVDLDPGDPSYTD